MHSLPNIYNAECITGPPFVSAAYTRVSYHSKIPSSNDEIKIKLPDVLTRKHWLKFTVLHCHVKSAGSDGLISRIMRSSIETPIVEYVQLGAGFLPLLSNEVSLLDDNVYTVKITANTNPGGERQSLEPSLAEIPIIRIRTKAVCSLHSSDRFVQSALSAHPIPLGRMPSSLRSDATVLDTLRHSSTTSPPSEGALLEALVKFPQASPLEATKHFLALIKSFFYSMIAGTGVFSEPFSNPYKHQEIRCQAFLTVLQLLGKLVSEADSNENTQDKEFLSAYADFIFDEDIPVKKYNYFFPDAENKSKPPSSANANVTKRHRTRKSLTDAEMLAVIVEEAEGNDSAAAKADESMDKAVTGLHEQYVHIDHGEDEVTTDCVVLECLAENMKTIVEDGDGPEDYTSDSTESVVENVDSEKLPSREVSKSHRRNKSGGAPVSIEALGEGEFSPSSRHNDGSDTVESVEGELSFSDSLRSIQGKMSVREFDALLSDNTEYSYNLDRLLANPTTEVDGFERKSWSKYITDSDWQAGSLISSFELLEDPLSDNNTNSLARKRSAALLDEIVEHVLQQVERAIVEIIISVIVVDLAIDVESEMKMLDTEYISDMREWKVSSSSMAADGTAFDFEKAWLLSHQEHSIIRNVLQNSLNETSDLDIEHDIFQRHTYSPVSINVQPIQPKYDSIDSYRDRWSKIVSLTTPPESDKEGNNGNQRYKLQLAGVQWWPWLYEVLVYQWSSVLTKILLLDSNQLLHLRGVDSLIGSYPSSINVSMKASPTTNSGSIKDTRSLLIEYGPFLLQIIFKSLSLRLIREKKHTPVLLDEQFFSALENLVNLLALEILTLSSKMWASKKLNIALVTFLRALFSLVAPIQVIRLLRSYFHSLKAKHNKVEETELRLQAIEIVCKFDHLVAVNFPFTLDAPHSMFNLTVHTPKSFSSRYLCFTASGIRQTQTPAPYWLIHTIIELIFNSYKQEEAKLKNAAVEILRDLLVKLAFDARYQSKDGRHRVVCMFLPLIKEIIDMKARLMTMRHDFIERREVIAILFFILEGTPKPLLRSLLRMMCAPSTGRSSNPSRSVSAAPIDSPNNTSSKSPVVSEVKESKLRRMTSKPAFLAKHSFQDFILCGLLTVFHLALDTFEVPQNVSGSAAVLSPNVTIQTASKESTAVVKASETSGRLQRLGKFISFIAAYNQSLRHNIIFNRGKAT